MSEASDAADRLKDIARRMREGHTFRERSAGLCEDAARLLLNADRDLRVAFPLRKTTP